MKTLPHNLLPASLPEAHRETIHQVIAAALAAVDPGEAVRRCLRVENGRLHVGDRKYPLGDIHEVRMISIGKAAAGMAAAAAAVLGDRMAGGVVVPKHVPRDLRLPPLLRIVPGSHPIPDERSVEAAGTVLAVLRGLREADLVVLLLSGGGSALVTRPAGGLSLDDLRETTRLLLASGAVIGEINAVRKHLDLVKGGGVAQAAWPASLAAVVISDVIGDALDQIASGPAVGDPTTYSDALQVLEKYRLERAVPRSVLNHLTNGAVGRERETLKPGDPLLARVQHCLAASNTQALEAAEQAALRAGFQARILTGRMEGEAREAGKTMALKFRRAVEGVPGLARPFLLAAGGETTVTRLSSTGRGGRNLELAAGAVEMLAGVKDIALITLATDGEDGSSPAAGAVVTGNTFEESLRAGLDLRDTFNASDTYEFFRQLGLALHTGPTGTNTNDLCLMFAF